MDIFRLREDIVLHDYAKYTRSFINISDSRIKNEVDKSFSSGLLWPEPLLQLNPSFASGGNVDDLIQQKILDPQCSKIFRIGKTETDPYGRPMQLYRHQTDAILAAQKKANYVLTTGTGSGKSLSYIIPIVDHILKNGTGRGIQAIIVYPMNALANSQQLELKKFLEVGSEASPVRFCRYTGQEKEKERQDILDNPPDILLTNYVMLELILTRPYERKLVKAAKNLRFLVFDELHTYRGRQGADVSILIRRLRTTLTDVGTRADFQCIGTSATLAGPGTIAEQQKEVAALASKIFGDEFLPDDIIMETLTTETKCENFAQTKAFEQGPLAQAVADSAPLPREYEHFIRHPLSAWIEHNLGITESAADNGRLIRCRPIPLEGRDSLAEKLSAVTGQPVALCSNKLKEALLIGAAITKPQNGKPVFAFKLHQFLSKGDTVYATIEPEETRYITLFGQKLAPGREDAPLYPLIFCRECGKEYYAASRVKDDTGTVRFLPLSPDNAGQDEGIQGYLYISAQKPWPSDKAAQLNSVPDDWIEEKNGKLTLIRSKRDKLPELWYVKPDGSAQRNADPGSTPAWFMPAPFPFCPTCGTSYEGRVDDFTKLGTLGTEGRSTSMTILSISTVAHLRRENELDKKARKFLCFSDNRQDASLQAGHFNDFVLISLVRSALYNALQHAGPQGLMYDVLPQKVFDALGEPYLYHKFPAAEYSQTPEARFAAAQNVDKAFRDLIEYLIYKDLRRGWRIVSPNLEQCDLLKFDYESLDEICNADDMWKDCGLLTSATPRDRETASKLLLDFLRSHLAISIACFDPGNRDRLIRQSRQQLREPWQLDENEEEKKLWYSDIAYPRAKAKNEENGIFLSPRSRFGRRLRKLLKLSNIQDTASVISALIKPLQQGGLLTPVTRDPQSGTGYQVNAAAIIWKSGPGKYANHDPFRIHQPDADEDRSPANTFFVTLYKETANQGLSMQAREHTAQVPSNVREEREAQFREAELPVLYCSPTMELGVDISQLNAVGMRNVPPTAANYAQRSGRAGRSGQPALVITYCAQGNSHDQYFFRRPELMVAGQVSTPRIDLANEDLIRAHIHALWLGASGLDLKHSLSEILDVDGQPPTLTLRESITAALREEQPKVLAKQRALAILQNIAPALQHCAWYTENWLDDVMRELPGNFEKACDHWRNLYRAAIQQRDRQTAIANDVSRNRKERDTAENLRAEAIAQINLLLGSGDIKQEDFYSYRYFASEGFLPGYNFPRLPLSAYIPGSRHAKKKDNEYISRARFLAISEFGPGSIIYHEGNTYTISKVILGAQDDGNISLGQVKICKDCGHLETDTAKDICDMCGSELPKAMTHLFRMRNVATRRRSRITSDEEERQRYGYQIVTGYQFVGYDGQPGHTDAYILSPREGRLARVSYGHGANLWRLNRGWRRRSKDSPDGFLMDPASGSWIRDSQLGRGNDEDQYLKAPSEISQITRVIPYVEDRKNCFLFKPIIQLSATQLYSLQAALKQAILQQFQLEDAELATEALPSNGTPRNLLFYEAAEGGAGILHQLVDDPTVIPSLARRALEICHFDESGNDLGAQHQPEPCVAACYDCLMSYSNQYVHKELDRRSIRDLLLSLTQSSIQTDAPAQSRAEHLEELKKKCDSNLERRWLDFLNEHNLNLPSDAQYFFEACHTRADFYYKDKQTAIYIDGPVHDYEDVRKRDEEQQECLEDQGIAVIRFADGEQWLIGIEKPPWAVREEGMNFTVGSLVSVRGRDWVVQPHESKDWLLLKPLGGSGAEMLAVSPDLGNIQPASFALPDPARAGDARSCRLLRDAVRLGLRSTTGPFRSFGHIAVDPRPYQLVPLLMAMRQPIVRLLVADDVGIGKTVEALLIVRELLDRGEIRRLAVLCPPQLAEQWQHEMADKFHIASPAWYCRPRSRGWSGGWVPPPPSSRNIPSPLSRSTISSRTGTGSTFCAPARRWSL